jgi:hypothetical protein
MPQDPNLYGQHAPKRRKKETVISSSLDFKAHLTSLLSNTSSQSMSTGRIKAANKKEDIFKGAKQRESKQNAKKSIVGNGPLMLKETTAEEETQELERTKRSLEEKARLYSAMRRGDYVPEDNEPAPLVDFDRKWAETNQVNRNTGLVDESDDDDKDESEDDEFVEYEDEFGRTRRGTRAEKERMERRIRRGELGATELERMSARPKAPEKLIYGDTVQTLAFATDDLDKMEALARKRDRSLTPPDMKHYEADKEIRTKGVGFYKFSKDEKTRTEQMQSLEGERLNTEKLRDEKESQKLSRKKQIEERRKEVEAKRARKMADSFLSGLASDLTGRDPS